MYTFGCMFEKNIKKIEETGIYNLRYISKDERLIKINLPILTPREKMHFDRLIPDITKKLKEFDMDHERLSTYEEYYRYYPQFFESYI